MDLWKNWKKVLWETFPDLENIADWAEWEGKGTSLRAKVYNNEYIAKSREVDIWNEKSSIYKSQWKGFEWWTGTRWSRSKREYVRLCERDSKLRSISDLGDAK